MLFAPLAGRDVKPFAPPFGLPDLTARPHPAAYIRRQHVEDVGVEPWLAKFIASGTSNPTR